MAANPNVEDKHYTVEEYFEMERESEDKHEYVDGKIYMMPGVREEHDIIFGNAYTSLWTQTRKRGCRVYSGDMRVRINDTRYVYPDLTIVCGKPEFIQWQGVDVITNPIIVVEILSPSTEAYDRGKKFDLYTQIETLQAYVLIAQDQPGIEHYVRQPNGKWLYDRARGRTAMLELPSIGCTLALAEVYSDVPFMDDGIINTDVQAP
ncbi:MAG: Uma2 family endonuclease [Chloroflexota bacterium]|nr:Uma2 family endonuclease [Chloroflexota bacterium]